MLQIQKNKWRVYESCWGRDISGGIIFYSLLTLFRTNFSFVNNKLGSLGWLAGPDYGWRKLLHGQERGHNDVSFL